MTGSAPAARPAVPTTLAVCLHIVGETVSRPHKTKQSSRVVVITYGIKDVVDVKRTRTTQTRILRQHQRREIRQVAHVRQRALQAAVSQIQCLQDFVFSKFVIHVLRETR